jgi:ubiquinone/menaquinone biosynthesis C-methylase UbiE
MDHVEVGRYWNGNADTWTALSRAGYDTYRNFLNTPAFFEMLPDVAGLRGLDIGCGEGYNTRLLRARGARVTALDIAPKFLRHARAAEESDPRSIDYLTASAVQLPFPTGTFDFATGFMSFMDIPEIECVIREAYRVLRAAGFLQFSISHPCFDTPRRRNLRDESGNTYAFEVADYFRNLEGEVSEWIFSAAPREEAKGLTCLRTPRFTRTLSQWLNALIECGYVLERMGEPRPSDAVVAEHPNLQDAQVVAYFLHVRARKPG